LKLHYCPPPPKGYLKAAMYMGYLKKSTETGDSSNSKAENEVVASLGGTCL
jgi:hypothetical protein